MPNEQQISHTLFCGKFLDGIRRLTALHVTNGLRLVMMISKQWTRRSVALLVAAASVGIVPAVGSSAPTVSAQADDVGAGGEFFPVTPTRLLDTRQAALDVAPAGAKAVNATFDLDVVGVGGVPASDVLAVAVNVTVINAPGNGYLSMRPSDFAPSATDEPTTLLNFTAGQVVPNFAIVGVGSEGKLTIELVAPGGGNAHVAVDVFGWVATSNYDGDGIATPDEADGARVVTQDPKRLLDTRAGQPPTGDATDSPIGEQASIEVRVRGQAGVPDTAAVTGVILNMAGIRPSATTYLAASPDKVPDGAADADTANGNFVAGDIKSNHVMVPLNESGSFWLYNRSGSIDVTLDVVGYLEKNDDDTTLQGRIVPLEAPFRSFDTRSDEFNNQKLGFSSWEDWSFQDFAGSVTLDGAPVGKQAGLLGNLAAFGLERNFPVQPVQSFMTLNPTDPRDRSTTPDHGQSDAPGNANLNVGESQVVTNMSLVTYGSNGDGDVNMVSAYNSDGKIHYTLDVYAVILAD